MRQLTVGSTDVVVHTRARASHGARVQPNGNDHPSSCPQHDVLDLGEQLAQTGSWEWDLRADELQWSANMFRLFGLRPGELTPTCDYILGRVHPEDQSAVTQRFASARRYGTLPPVTYRITWPDGSAHVLRTASAVAELRDGRPSRLIGSVQDITELVEAQRQTEESLTLFKTLASTAPVGFAFVDREFRIVNINQNLAAINGNAPEELIGLSLAEAVPDVWGQMEPVYRGVLDTGEPVLNRRVERRRTGQDRRHLLASYYPVRVDESVIGVGVVVVDITERAEAEQFRAAVMDTMVEGLYALDGDGRLAFMNSTASKLLGWSEDELRGRPMHAAIHFQYADGSPHPESECDLLKATSGGDPVQVTDDAFTRKDGTIFPVAFSVAPLELGTEKHGVVVVFRDTTTERAEQAQVKRKLDTLAWVGRTRDAIDEHRLALYAQPIVPLAGGRPSQELLLRMIGKDGEVILPGSFLPVAEEYGLIAEIDRWVIGETARLAGTGQCVEANLSAESFSNLDLLAVIERELRDHNADPADVVFEITETALMQNIAGGEAFARGLGEIGCRVALDDFGTGFGSFTYLQKIPVAFLKIDIDCLRDLLANEVNQHLVKTVVRLARDFGCETIAEGVEDAATLSLLTSYGVDFAQGFYVGLPAPLPAR